MARSSQYLRRTPAWGAPAAAICALTLQNTICAWRLASPTNPNNSALYAKSAMLPRAIVIAAVRPACCACEPHDMRAARHLGATEPRRVSHADRCRRARRRATSRPVLAKPGRERSRAVRLRAARARPPEERDRADRLREHRLARRARGHGQRAHQQVRRGLSRQPLLRRLPVRRPGREPRHRARQEAVRLPLRQRAVALGQHRQPGGIHGADEPRRYLHGAQPRRRRTPDARLARQHVGQVVQGGALHRAPAGPPHRHGRGRHPGAPAQAEGDRGGRQRLSAHHRLRQVPRHRRRGRRLPDGRHGAFRGSGRRRLAPEPVPARPRRHLDHAQDACAVRAAP